MLIHATITVSGDEPQQRACEKRLRQLLAPEFLRGEVTEQHLGDALCYDLKVAGGIPFPAFAQASQEFSELSFDADWVNVAAGERVRLTLVNGRATRQSTERLTKET